MPDTERNNGEIVIVLTAAVVTLHSINALMISYEFINVNAMQC